MLYRTSGFGYATQATTRTGSDHPSCVADRVASDVGEETRMDRADVGDRFRWIATVLLSAIALGGVVDLALDRPETLWSFHVVFEITMLTLSLGAVIYLWLGWRDTRHSLERTRAQLETRRAERDIWRVRAEKILRGLGEAIDAQLGEWGLTPVERETALLLLKGFGHKQIAELQQKSERTVRQHAVAVYRKSGLSGRAELSAFFLEDLLLPTAADEPANE
ncbi:MAG: helix-turn-helix transcriptional regulator [Deltaproteobacteria bacterium]|nr:helix-turn-helix transcriptional regulator [Deltaproteobacteria bacterium]